MKKSLLFLSLFVLLQATNVFAQSIELPVKQYLCDTGSVNLDGTVINTTDTGVTYQWYYSISSNVQVTLANEITGATNPMLIVTTANNGSGHYKVVATFSDGTTTQVDQTQITSKDFLENYFESPLCNQFSIYELQSYSYLSGTGNITFQYYETEADANLGNANTLENYYIFGFTTIYIRIEENNGQCVEVIPLQIAPVFQPLFAGWVSNMGSCSSDSTNNTFDLTTNDAQIINGQTWATISYFLMYNDAWNLTNPITNPSSYTAISPNQTIYARIHEVNNFGCDAFDSITQFQLLSAPQPTPNTTVDYVVCDNTSGASNDGVGLFNLPSKNSLVLSGLSISQFTISYHTALVDAQNSSNSIVSPEAYVSTNATVYSRVESNLHTECVEISQMDLQVQNTCDDISVNLVSYWGAPRPGFVYKNKLVIKNNGPVTVSSGTVEFAKDVLLTYNNTTGVTAGNTLTPTANGFTLNFVNLAVGSAEEIIIDLTVDVSATLGDILTSTATYITATADVYPENNTSNLSEIIIGSYDPNDIIESRGPDIVHSTFTNDDYLYYTVRFQNVGTASAINVAIDNTLDAKLDKTTFEMLHASHTNSVERVYDQLIWKFDNINLADATNNEPYSHGYVHYKIKPLAGYSVGDIIPNTASIVFDFNASIITNTFDSEFIAPLGVEDYKLSNYSIVPNPTSGLLTVKSNTLIAQIEVYNYLGQVVMDNNNQNTIDISKLNTGLYFIKIKGIKGDSGIKKILKR